MFTRRSWRNQNRAFADQFKPPEVKPPTDAERLALMEGHLLLPHLSKRTKAMIARDIAAIKRKQARTP